MIDALSIARLAITRGDRLLFEGFSAEVRAGEALALTGANGSGKTSILRCIAGFIRPAAGEIRFGSVDADEARHGGMHFLGHQDALKNQRTAREELEFQAHWLGGSAGGIAEAIEVLELAPLLGLEIRKLSAGQRRRLALARLIAAPRSLWLLDEPMAPLDARRRVLLGELMARRLAEGGIVVAAVHDPLPVAAKSVEVGA